MRMKFKGLPLASVAMAVGIIGATVGVGARSMGDAQAAPTGSGSLTVTVFQDFNANGSRDTSESAANPAYDKKVAGAQVKAICVTDTGPDGVAGTADDTQASADATGQDANGDYVVAAPGSPCRIEVTPTVGYQSGASGSTTVAFVDTVPNSIDVGIARPQEFCQDNPDLFVSCYTTSSYGTGTFRSIKRFAWQVMSDPDGNPNATWTGNGPGPDPLPDATGVIATNTELGAVFGVAADGANNRAYSAAFFKGGAAFGPGGTGAIYATDLTTNSTSVYADLNAIFGAGTAGANNHVFSTPRSAWTDNAAKTDAGKVGLGDLQLSQDGATLWVTNLADRKVYGIPTSGAIDASTIQVLAPPATPTDCPAAGDVRVMGLGVDVNGDLHLGGVCSGESSQNNNDLHTYVWKLTGSSWTLVYDGEIPDDDTVYTPANPIQTSMTQPRYWRNGQNCSVQFVLFVGDTVVCPPQDVPPQYEVSDVEFDGDNAMILAYRDRQNDMFTLLEADTGNARPTNSTAYNATLRRICRSDAAAPWIAESAMTCGGQTSGPEVPAVNPGNDPAGDEYYWGDRQGDGGWESVTGGAVQIGGWPVISTTVDPQNMNSDGQYVSGNPGTGGVSAFNNRTGAQKGALDLMLNSNTGSGTSPATFAKLASMGDVAVLCDKAPVEIGNRVWHDVDGDGIQDPGEAPIAGVTISLYRDAGADGTPDGAAIATVTTDANGQYIFSSDSRFTDTTGRNYGIAELTFNPTDPTANRFVVGAPTTTTVSGADLGLTGQDETVAAGDPAATNNDWVDSDVAPDTGFSSTIDIAGYGKNDHRYDIGYSTPPDRYDLAIIKTLPTAPTSPLAIGDTATFEITVRNQGTLNSGAFSVTDTLPPGTSYVSDTSGVTATTGTGTVTWAFPDTDQLAPSTQKTFNVVISIDDNTRTTYRNDVEITADSGADVDSVPNSNDAGTTPWENHNDPTRDTDGPYGTLDDHDAEAFSNTPEYDLAIIKTLPTPPVSPVAIGDTATFKVTVTNQGSIVSGAYAVTDTLPAGTSYVSDTSGVTATTGSGTVTWAIPATSQLDPNKQFTFDVVVRIDDNTKTSYRNDVEITADSGADVDSDPTSNDAGTDPWDNHNDPTRDTDGPNGNLDDHDAEVFTNAPVYDLALVKTLPTRPQTPLAIGDTATFRVTVRNQGSVVSGAFSVTDTLPAGTSFVSDTSGVTRTTGTGTVTWAFPAAQQLDPAGELTFDVVIRIEDNTKTAYRNDAEITADSGNDKDSDPTSNDAGTDPWDNHNDPTRDTDGPNSNLDDHDAEILPNTPVYDLALVKTVKDAHPATLAIGDELTFTITVRNQGSVASGAYSVTDTLPAGTSYVSDTSGATATPGSGTVTWAFPTADQLDPAQQVSFDVVVRIDADHESYRNDAEITADSGDDVDSDPTSNDAGTDPWDNHNDPTRDTDGPGGALDDHDAEIVTAPYDLALRKTIDTEATAFPVRVGDKVTFTLDVFNQGPTVQSVNVVDYIDPTLWDAFDLAANPAGTTGGDHALAFAWSANDPHNPVVTVTGALGYGEHVTVPVTLTISKSLPAGQKLVNTAEISAFDNDTDPNNTAPTDEDSSPDTTNDDELVDDVIDNTGGDEDDHDIATLQVMDLALRKTVADSTPKPVISGGLVTFNIEVFNQGTVKATGITLTDYINPKNWQPFDASLNAAGTSTGDASLGYTWAAGTDSAVVTIDGTIDPGDSVIVPITLRVAPGVHTAKLANTAEITTETPADYTGPDLTDIDSTPDGTDGDHLVDDVIDNSGGDEDDHDIAVVQTSTFDLALVKRLAKDAPSVVGIGSQVTFDITVTNQGDVDATDVAVTDYLPAGLVLDDAKWHESKGTVEYGERLNVAAGASATIHITTRVADTAAVGSVVNWAEISSQSGPNGEHLTDIDSVPNGDQFSEPGETDDLKDDNVVDQDGRNGGDEDDHDPATITVGTGDLAIQKTALPFQQSTGRASWDLVVANVGTVSFPAGVTVTDALPKGLKFVSASGQGWTCSEASATVSCQSTVPVAAGATMAKIVLVTDVTGTGKIVNVAEVDGGKLDRNPKNDRDDADITVTDSGSEVESNTGTSTTTTPTTRVTTVPVTTKSPSELALTSKTASTTSPVARTGAAVLGLLTLAAAFVGLGLVLVRRGRRRDAR